MADGAKFEKDKYACTKKNYSKTQPAMGCPTAIISARAVETNAVLYRTLKL